ncbi:MAG: hypothetical protein GX752_02430 [Clostridium sp.]|nr:hypothetical protein [Clostridium sp.]
MGKKAYKTLKILLILALGILIGGYIGLVLGGTFLGGFDIYEKIGIEGYEISTYIGSLIGVILGVYVIMKLFKKDK